MAGYDSPNWTDKLPGGGIVPQGTGAPGTSPPGAGIDAGQGGVERDTGTPVMVNIPGASLVNSDMAHVGPSDTLVPSEVQMYGALPDPLTGIGVELGQSGAGLGNVVTPHHPASANVGSLADQLKAARVHS